LHGAAEPREFTGEMMNFYERIHFLVRAWRYRLRGEKFGISYLLARDLAGKTAVDIGANRGIYSYWMHRQVGATGRVVAFEPQPELSIYLQELRSAYRLDRLEIAECGLSSQCGELTLRRPKTHWGGASFDRYENGRPDLDLIPAQVTTLDRYFADHPSRPIGFIKCDVEGHELQVFRGGREILRNDRPDLLFECNDAMNPACPVFTWLKSLGYEGYCFAPHGFAPVSEYPAIYSQLHKRALRDFVFVPRERAQGIFRMCA
jgi:FkbM family methyltransferase